MLRWPDLDTVREAVERWAQEAARAGDDILRIGYFGSYARGDWGVGSDLDLVIVVESSAQPFETRATRWDTTRLPVPTDLLVYTRAEWERLRAHSPFGRRLAQEAKWVYVPSLE